MGHGVPKGTDADDQLLSSEEIILTLQSALQAYQSDQSSCKDMEWRTAANYLSS